MSNKYINLIKDTFIFALGNLGSKLILFLLVPLYTNYMTAAEYGTSDLVFTLSQLLTSVMALVVFDAVIRFGLEEGQRKGNVLCCALAVVVAGGAVMACITPLFGRYEELAPWRWYLCVYVFLGMLNPVLTNYLKICDKNKQYALISVLQTLIMASLNVILLVWLRMGIRGYLIANIGGALVCGVCAFTVGNVGNTLRHSRFEWKLLKRMLAFSAPLILVNVSWWVVQSSSKIIIEWILGASVLGIYTVATKIPSLINVITSIFTQAWGISSFKEIEQTEKTDFYAEVFAAYQTGVFGVTVLLNSVMKPFMQVYVGAEFQEAGYYVPILMSGAAFAAVGSFWGTMHSALKKSVNNMVITVLGALVNVFFSIFLLPRIGLWGAVVGTLLAHFVIAAARMFDVLRYIPISVPRMTLLCNVIIILWQALAVALDVRIIAVSGCAAVLFVLINRKILVRIICLIGEKLYFGK